MLFKGKSQCKDDAARVVCSEHQNQYIVNNQSRLKIYKYKIDGSILTVKDVGEKCDYIIEIETIDKPTVFVVELKGSDLNKAISQISTTIKRFGLTKTHMVKPRIVIHKVRTQQINDSRYRAFKNLYPDMIVKEKTFTDTI